MKIEGFDILYLSGFLELPPGALNNFFIRKHRKDSTISATAFVDGPVSLELMLEFMEFRYNLPMCTERHKHLIRKALRNLEHFAITS